MIRRFVGAVLFLTPGIGLFEIAGRLASEPRTGWGWFVFAGLIFSGIALNLWTGKNPTPQCPRCQKPHSQHDLE